jgi:Fic family protein
MARAGYWLCEYVSVSRILKKARGQYARAYLYTEADDNDATYFMLYQLRVLLRGINDLHVYLAKKASELEVVEKQLHRLARSRGEWNARQLALLNHALKHSEARYTVESHQRSHNVTYQTARTDLLKLADQGLLTQRKIGRAFVFEPSRRLSRLGSS